MSWRDKITYRIDEIKGCMIVTSHTPDNEGYIRIRFNGKKEAVHRLAFSEVNGAIPFHKDVHHKCENRICINVEHLELLSKSAHGRLTRLLNTEPNCPRGHVMEGENLGIDKRGKRFCRICSRAMINDWYKRNKALIKIRRALKNGI